MVCLKTLSHIRSIWGGVRMACSIILASPNFWVPNKAKNCPLLTNSHLINTLLSLKLEIKSSWALSLNQLWFPLSHVTLVRVFPCKKNAFLITLILTHLHFRVTGWLHSCQPMACSACCHSKKCYFYKVIHAKAWIHYEYQSVDDGKKKEKEDIRQNNKIMEK